MNNTEILKKLEEIERTVKFLIKELKGNAVPAQLSPFQRAVKVATSKNSSDDEVKDALKVFVDSAEQMTVNQFAFVCYFLAMNKQHLSDDVNWFVGIELGKHKYDQRDTFIDEVTKVIDEKYRSNQSISSGLKVYLNNLRRK